MDKPTFDDIIDKCGLHPKRVKAIYLFGSRVYGTDHEDSDWDIKVIANGTRSNIELRRGLHNIHIITPPDFQELVRLHHPGALECYFLPDSAKIYEGVKWDFEYKPGSLRHYFSRVSSNSWVKCKKKLDDREYYIGIKSLFHSIRIPMFGTQIAKHGKITDFSCANDIHDELFSKYWTWDELDERFREVRNNTLTEFRKVTPKG